MEASRTVEPGRGLFGVIRQSFADTLRTSKVWQTGISTSQNDHHCPTMYIP